MQLADDGKLANSPALRRRAADSADNSPSSSPSAKRRAEPALSKASSARAVAAQFEQAATKAASDKAPSRLAETHDPLAAMAGVSMQGGNAAELRDTQARDASLDDEQEDAAATGEWSSALPRADRTVDALDALTKRERRFRRRLGLRGARSVYDCAVHDGADPDDDAAAAAAADDDDDDQQRRRRRQ